MFCLLAGSSFADVVYKMDGTRVRGKIVKEDDDVVVVKTPYGEIEVDKCDIDRIERGEEEPAKTQPKETQKPAVEKPKKPVTPKKPAKPKKPKVDPAGGDDKLLGEKNLKKLQEICKSRMKAYKGVPWKNAHKYEVTAGGHKIFDIECNSTKKVGKHYKWLLGKLYAKYCKVFKAFRVNRTLCRIYIHRNYTEFREMRRKPPGVGGYYMPGQHILVGFHGTMGSLKTDSILAHEGCHLFQDLISMFGRNYRSPIWLTEGMAVLMEAAKIGRDGEIHIRGVSPDRLTHLQNMIKGGNPIALKTLLSTSQRQFTAKHYAHAGMFTWWLIKGSKSKKLMLLYNDYVRIATGGDNQRARRIQPGDFEKLCSRYKTSLGKLEPQWRKWVMKQKVERPGKVVGNKFVCDEFGFSVRAPGPGWKIDTKETHGALCKITHKDIKGFIFVSVGGTFGTPDINEFLAMVDQMRQRSQSKLQNYKRISREVKKFMKGTLDGYDTTSESANPDSPITKEFQRRRAVSISMVDTRYSISCMADPDKFAEYEQHFNKVVDSLRIDASKLD
jgi:hypothetical protein